MAQERTVAAGGEATGVRVTTDYIRERFALFNGMMFGGRLEMPPLKVSNARSTLGQVRCKRSAQRDGTWRYGDFEFVISGRLKLNERAIDDVIIHEMIHYYILSNRIQDTGPHGVVFRRMMDEINSRYGRNIGVRHRMTEEEHATDSRRSLHMVCVVRGKGWTGIIVAARTRVRALWDAPTHILDVTEWNWYASYDPYFNRFPHVRTLKVYKVAEEELRAHLSGAHAVVMTDKGIRIRLSQAVP